jgi:hypothetical protein
MRLSVSASLCTPKNSPRAFSDRNAQTPLFLLKFLDPSQRLLQLPLQHHVEIHQPIDTNAAFANLLFQPLSVHALLITKAPTPISQIGQLRFEVRE